MFHSIAGSALFASTLYHSEIACLVGIAAILTISGNVPITGVQSGWGEF